MKPFEVADAFIEEHDRGVPLARLQEAFADSLRELGMRYFSCGLHVNPLGPGSADRVFHSYPREWVRYLSEGARYRTDPVCRYAEERRLPFFWDDAEFRAGLAPSQWELLNEGERQGVAHGYTVPLHSPGAPSGSCSVVPDVAPLDRSACRAVLIMGCFMFDALLREGPQDRSGTRSPRLSERERQCVRLAAQGKDDWSIGSLLSISERTAHNHIERAKRRLGVCTRVQVVVRALSEGQISFNDVIDSRRSLV